jgi:hypothetical protein
MVSFRQSDQHGVFLNETLVFDFDRELDRASVTQESVRIVGPEKKPARGRLEVTGKKVLFHPDVPRSADLADGGLAPASVYSVAVAGFPFPDGVRDRDGRPLAESYFASFTTVDPGATTGQVLEDLTPDRAEPMRLAATEIGPVDAIELVCGEPVDPRTLVAEDFELLDYESTSRIPVRVELRENRFDGARIEVRAIDAEGNLEALDVGTYQLWVGEKAHLRDFSGHPVLTAWFNEPLAGTLRVVERDERSTVVDGRLEDFLDERRRSPAHVEGVAGMAAWRGGVVTISDPAAAGDGLAGKVSLAAEEPRIDVQATAIELPVGEVVRLTGAGLVVVRSQGRLTVDGELVRDVEGKQRRAQELGLERVEEWNRWASNESAWDTEPMAFAEGESLTLWLSRAREQNAAWTVLIAGGDLEVRGRIWTDGPLLLVAGGWIRVVGDVLARPGQNWTLGTAGTSNAPLVMDAPRRNPLAEAQTWAVLSAPIRPSARPRRWWPATVQGSVGGGSFRVSYLGERDGPGASVEVVGPVDSPVLLERCDAVRLRVDLTMFPGSTSPVWDPPIVDAVEIAWESP